MADTFARNYIGDVEGFVNEIAADPDAVKNMSYEESWDLIKKGNNSLNRHTNLNILLTKLFEEAES